MDGRSTWSQHLQRFITSQREHWGQGLWFTDQQLLSAVLFRWALPAFSCYKNGLKLSGLALGFFESKRSFSTEWRNVIWLLLPSTKCPFLLFICGCFTTRKVKWKNVQIQKICPYMEQGHVPITLQALSSAVITNMNARKKPKKRCRHLSGVSCACNMIGLLFKTHFRGRKYFSGNAAKVKPAQIICCVSTIHMNEICPGTMNLVTDLS